MCFSKVIYVVFKDLDVWGLGAEAWLEKILVNVFGLVSTQFLQSSLTFNATLLTSRFLHVLAHFIIGCCAKIHMHLRITFQKSKSQGAEKKSVLVVKILDFQRLAGIGEAI